MKLPYTLLYSIVLFGFTLGIHRGKLALWKDGRTTPVEVYPLSVATLPETDRQLLTQGIRAETIQELSARLEDYLS